MNLFFVQALLSVMVAAAFASATANPALAQGPAGEVQDLRERLTEREDENRVEEPLIVDFLGRSLSLNGQYEISLETIDQIPAGAVTNEYGQILLEQEIEVEAFYSLSPSLSLFIQLGLAQEEDLDSDTEDDTSDIYVERGEIWIYAEKIAGTPFGLKIGRLDFEDDRLWWWDDDLDAVRVIYELETFDIELALARELAPTRSDESRIDPEHNQVLRLIAEIAWEWNENHEIEIFGLYHDDRSKMESPGQTVHLDHLDESDAELTWIGIRASGASDLKDRGIIGYWIDLGHVYGDEQLLAAKEEETDTLLPGHRAVEKVTRPKVRGWAFDVGGTWILPTIAEPRLTVAYAMGSGDSKPDNGTDRAFRQTGLHGNEPGFGGVQRFQGYGELLDPELSNISILTLGVGCSIFDSSSIDFIYHSYRLVERTDSLRDARIDAELTGMERDLGQGIDLIIGIEEWDTIELEFSASAFRAGDAFGRDDGEWIYGSFFSFRFAF